MSQTSPETETAHKQYAEDWKRQIISAGGDENVATQAVTLAALNGLFDHLSNAPCPVNPVCDLHALLEIRDFLQDIVGGAEITERSRDNATSFVSIMDSQFGAAWNHSFDFAQPSPVSPVSESALSVLIKQYALDLRRNPSGGDDYPYEFAKGVADYLGVLIKRAKGDCTCAQAGFPDSCDNCDSFASAQCPPQQIAAPGNDQLSNLWNAIVENTKGDGFWIGEILLTTLEREVGFNPAALADSSPACEGK